MNLQGGSNFFSEIWWGDLYFEPKYLTLKANELFHKTFFFLQ